MTDGNISQKPAFHKAERRQAKLRIGIFGSSGSGKTMSALKLARGLATGWDKIAVIDTENGSADLYSHLGNYNVLTLKAPFNPEKYIEAISYCEQQEMEVIIIDSITHEWAGEGGILDESDRLGKTAKNAFTIWGQLTPRHNRFISKILFANAIVIACGRSKQDYVLNEIEKNGRKVNVPEKVGLKAITREGFDYEMTTSFDLDITHFAVSTKDRTGLFQDKAPGIIDEEYGKRLAEWNSNGAPNPDDQKRAIAAEFKRLGVIYTKDNIGAIVALNTGLELIPANYPAIIEKLSAMVIGTVKMPAKPVDPAKFKMLRDLVQKKFAFSDDATIVKYLAKLHNINVENLDQLTEEQINNINDKLIRDESPAPTLEEKTKGPWDDAPAETTPPGQ